MAIVENFVLVKRLEEEVKSVCQVVLYERTRNSRQSDQY